MIEVKLTQYSHGAGCGCKISPEKLTQILDVNQRKKPNPLLLVGHDTKDDAAIYDLENGTCIMNTLDFFTPIVDDPFLYGGIASSNAISDIYAMGGTPLMAIAILGWPVDKISLDIAKKVLEGSRDMCAQANIPLAGGHSIDTLEPLFGLAVTGRLPKENIKRNNTAKAESVLYLTKPLGVGIITTAQKKGNVQAGHLQKAMSNMLILNKCGTEWGALPYVNAMTDVTGFGLLGHLIEICDGSDLSAEIEFDKIPVFDFLDSYLQLENVPGGTHRNWKSYAHRVEIKEKSQKWILADPQTSGGLLVSVDAGYAEKFEQLSTVQRLNLKPFGRLTKRQQHSVIVK